jgi:hypothetical protein
MKLLPSESDDLMPSIGTERPPPMPLLTDNWHWELTTF